MNKKIAIYCPNVGLKSETFIQKHINCLYPENTVVICHNQSGPVDASWDADCPTYYAQPSSGLTTKLLRLTGKLSGQNWGILDDSTRIKQFLREHKVDTILGEYLNLSWPLLSVAKTMGIRFFVHAHGIDLSCLFREKIWKRRYADYRFADGVIVVNSVMRERLLSIGIPEGKIHTIPYGVNVAEKLNVRGNHSTVKCLAVGRMVNKKAPLKLLKAFMIAVKKTPNLHLNYIGEGPLYASAMEFIVNHNLTSKVKLLGGGNHNEVLDAMRESDIFLQHSIVDPETGDEEGLPVAILEAMAMSLPVVATRHAGIPEAIIDGETGFLVNEGDISMMAESITELAKDSKLRTRMGEAGWLRARQLFTWENERDNLIKAMGL